LEVNPNTGLRKLPAVNEVLQTSQINELLARNPRFLVIEAVREVLSRIRRQILAGDNLTASNFSKEELLSVIAGGIIKEVDRKAQPKLRQVINATGVVLHTNLGRSLLSLKAQQAIKVAASRYINIELDLETGRRGSRYTAVENLLTRLTGAESALVVNNNAAAVFLALNTIASGKEVIVSRGQLVEIGGSFRIPDIMRHSGAVLVEVGTTNKTYLDDYRRAISSQTALLLHVHTSNYRILGFTHETHIPELAGLAGERGLPLMSDLGSGVLLDLTSYGLPSEPTVQEIVAAGADIVTFSGDKLLGGPQAGIILGKKHYLEKIKKNPLTRALRIDKLSIAALEATLGVYLDEEQARKEIPVLKMLTLEKGDLEQRARQLQFLLSKEIGEYARVAIEEAFSQAGGGALPTVNLPSAAVVVEPKDIQIEELNRMLRANVPAVIGHIRTDRLLLDVRTLQEGEIELVAQVFKKVFTEAEKE